MTDSALLVIAMLAFPLLGMLVVLLGVRGPSLDDLRWMRLFAKFEIVKLGEWENNVLVMQRELRRAAEKQILTAFWQKPYRLVDTGQMRPNMKPPPRSAEDATGEGD